MPTNTKELKPVILNAFCMGTLGLQCPGLWKHPKDKSKNFNKIEHWTYLAQLLERGKFNAVFLADVLGPYDVYDGPGNLAPVAVSGAQFPTTEPSAVVSAMAAVTKDLSFGITFLTMSEAPYHLARRLATLDHLTNGRVGWNVVSSYLASGARNLLNGAELTPHSERYNQAQEYLDVVYKLFLSSWADDALELLDGVFTNPDKIREIAHEGKYFKVPGVFVTHPTPQRMPVVIQAGTSRQGKEFAAKNAELVFITTFSAEELAKQIADIKKIAKEKYGRPEGSIKFLQLITPVVGKTHEEAEAKYQELQLYGDLEGAQALFSGWTGVDIGKYGPDENINEAGTNAVKSFLQLWNKKSPGEPEGAAKTRKEIAKQITVGGLGPVFYGTAEEVADEIQHWVEVSGVDGFNVTYAVNPGTFEEFIEHVVPVLQERGLAQQDYPKVDEDRNLTFREQLFGTERKDPTYFLESHPAYDLRWRAGESRDEFERRLNKKRKSEAQDVE
ncbi:Dimethyl-sulfide monooxygenase [Candida viswanathii]|uniref:Dimethyl-sulfide monooxygenase n=1 Tax=Candida viswanathii TaxID=5486 RepID=A0A367YGK8_9ASCO|nr:Dimethyl-sulfide monooxygenase [Candida viswanathii]